MNSLNELWEMVKEECKELVSESIFNVWFNDIEMVSFDENKVVLSVSGFKKKIIEARFLGKIKQAFYNVMGFETDIELIDAFNYPSASDLNNSDSDGNGDEENKYDKDTFETFVVGPSNKFAHAAAIAVAANPGGSYNPLFIHGNSGLGKTHLLNAICHEIKRNNPDANIVYTRGEEFTNEIVYYLAVKNMVEFHNKFR
ncbi:MAG: DnaA ATPase domain-containing protein, partial [Acutalibacteraceae bacterium]